MTSKAVRADTARLETIEPAQHRACWCAAHRCKREPRYFALSPIGWRGPRAVVFRENRLCERHAARFAKRHGLAFSELSVFPLDCAAPELDVLSRSYDEHPDYELPCAVAL